MEVYNNNIEKNILNKTFENKNYLFDQENQFNSQLSNNNDIKAQTLSLFGINIKLLSSFTANVFK